MGKAWPVPTITVQLTTAQKAELEDHYHAVPSQGCLFAQVWPTHLRVACYTPEEAQQIADVLKAINERRKAL